MKLYTVTILLAGLAFGSHTNPWAAASKAPVSTSQDINQLNLTNLKLAPADMGAREKKNELAYGLDLLPYEVVYNLFKAQGIRTFPAIKSILDGTDKRTKLNPALLLALKELKPVDKALLDKAPQDNPVIQIAKEVSVNGAVKQEASNAPSTLNVHQSELESLGSVIDAAIDLLTNFKEKEVGMKTLKDLLTDYYNAVTSLKGKHSFFTLANFFRQKQVTGESIIRAFLEKHLQIKPEEHQEYRKHLATVLTTCEKLLAKDPKHARARLAVILQDPKINPKVKAQVQRVQKRAERIDAAWNAIKATYDVPKESSFRAFFKDVQLMAATINEGIDELVAAVALKTKTVAVVQEQPKKVEVDLKVQPLAKPNENDLKKNPEPAVSKAVAKEEVKVAVDAPKNPTQEPVKKEDVKAVNKPAEETVKKIEKIADAPKQNAPPSVIDKTAQPVNNPPAPAAQAKVNAPAKVNSTTTTTGAATQPAQAPPAQQPSQLKAKTFSKKELRSQLDAALQKVTDVLLDLTKLKQLLEKKATV